MAFRPCLTTGLALSGWTSGRRLIDRSAAGDRQTADSCIERSGVLCQSTALTKPRSGFMPGFAGLLKLRFSTPSTEKPRVIMGVRQAGHLDERYYSIATPMPTHVRLNLGAMEEWGS